MHKQPAFSGLRHAMKKKQTRRAKFLAEMEAVVPWTGLLSVIEPHYPKAEPKGGRPPMPVETMLRVCFLQQWYALSDPMAEEMLYDSDAMRHFAGIELGDDPDETTILDFRHLLEKHGLTERSCQTNSNQSQFAARRPISGGAELAPLVEGNGSVRLEEVASGATALGTQSDGDVGVDGGKSLAGLVVGSC